MVLSQSSLLVESMSSFLMMLHWQLFKTKYTSVSVYSKTMSCVSNTQGCIVQLIVIVNTTVCLVVSSQNWAPPGCEKLNKCLKGPPSKPFKCDWDHWFMALWTFLPSYFDLMTDLSSSLKTFWWWRLLLWLICVSIALLHCPSHGDDERFLPISQLQMHFSSSYSVTGRQLVMWKMYCLPKRPSQAARKSEVLNLRLHNV